LHKFIEICISVFDVFAADVAAAAPLLHFLRRRGLAYKKYGID